MDLPTALKFVDSPLPMYGSSNAKLLTEVKPYLNSSIDPLPRPISFLDGGVNIRPADILLSLAEVTRPHYQSDLHDAYRHWALFRYIGIFDAIWDGSLGLSDAGKRVVANQRRVLSEELGIGIAVCLAERWIRAYAPNAHGVRCVDADIALDEGVVVAAGATKRVQPQGRRRPDYLVVADDSTVMGRFRLGVLECKGSTSKQHSLRQLAKAAQQIRGVKIAGRFPAALAVASVIRRTGVTYHALEWNGSAGEGGELIFPGGEPPEVSDDLIRRPIVSETSDDWARVEPPPRGVGHADVARAGQISRRASWARLGLLAGNRVAFEQWAPGSMRRKYRAPEVRRGRSERQTSDGRPCIGVVNVVSVPGGVLEVFLGIDAAVDEALSQGDEAQVLRAQRLTHETWHAQQSRPTDDGPVTATHSDGAVMLLKAL